MPFVYYLTCFFSLTAVIISDLEILQTNISQTICLQDVEKGKKKIKDFQLKYRETTKDNMPLIPVIFKFQA